MGEARRRRLLAGTSAPRTPARADNPISRSDLLAMVHAALANSAGSTVTGVTIIPAEDGVPVYVSAEQARRPPGKARH
jgi:hypothetical protein